VKVLDDVGVPKRDWELGEVQWFYESSLSDCSLTIWETYTVLLIEAARAVLRKQDTREMSAAV
jgi:hypothetical protein